jgi:hypothetical protein
MDNQPSRFLQNEKIVVLIENGQRNRLRLQGQGRRRGNLHPDLLAGDDTMGGLRDPAIHPNMSLNNKPLNLSAGGFRHHVCEVPIETFEWYGDGNDVAD